jgi:hypothetical protein
MIEKRHGDARVDAERLGAASLCIGAGKAS